MKNITLSADQDLIEAARRRASAERTTLNAQFRLRLQAHVVSEHQADVALAAIQTLQASVFSGGRTFAREEMNER